MPLPPHLVPVFDKVTAAQATLPPLWRAVASVPVGGLVGVGFIGDSDHLLVLSSQGRGIFDCVSGEKIARDPKEDFEFDQYRLAAPAFDRFSGQTVQVAGIHGGGLALTTSDGWSADDWVFDWPVRIVTVSPPGHSAFFAGQGRPSDVYRVAADSEILTFGFSPSGRSFIVATSSDLHLIARPE